MPGSGENRRARQLHFHLAAASHVTMDTEAIRPIRFANHRSKAIALNQPLREFGTPGVEFMRAMRGFPDQHQLCAADALNKGIEVSGARKWSRGLCDDQRLALYSRIHKCTSQAADALLSLRTAVPFRSSEIQEGGLS
jgi:hypothetical protein